MLFGHYEHTLDEKGRLVIPRKLRDELGQLVYILKGFDGALAVYQATKFEELASQIDKMPFNKASTRSYIRAQLSSACDLEVDKMGRVQLPTHLLNKYSIGKDVVILGVGDHMEIWDKAAYEEYEKNMDKDFEDIAEELNLD